MKIDSRTTQKTNALKALSLLTLTIALAACGQTPPVSQSAVSTSNAIKQIGATNIVQGQWYVELSGDPTDLSAQSIGSQQVSFRAQAKTQGIDYQELKSYSLLFNGFVVKADSTALRQLQRLNNVIGVYPVQRVQLPREQAVAAPSTPQMFSARSMTGADIANNELGLTGKGVKVGVIDTGIDLDHPAFAGRVIKQYDFVGDAYDSNKADKNTPVPDPIANDCAGHGSHVSGIVGGKDPTNGFKGVAPDVLFGEYKVFGCEGSTDDPVILDAMERAVSDGMQVINMSLGSSYGWAESPLSKASSRVIKRGVVMVNSQGNSGDTGQFSSGAPAAGEQVISVGSVQNVALRVGYALLDDGTKVPYSEVGDTGELPKTGTLTFAKNSKSSPTTTNDGCLVEGVSPFAPNSLNGKVALIRRGSCTFYEKLSNAQNAGAVAAVIYNNKPELLSSVAASGTPPITIPAIGISGDLGASIDAKITAGATTLTWTDQQTTVTALDGNTSATSSSYGPTPTLTFKPEVSAPGGNIYSTWPRSLIASGYNTISGTSMASPHVAGAVALLLQARPNLSAKDVVTLLQNTAQPVSLRFSNKTYDGLLNYVQQQGAGMINIPAAVSNVVSATPSKLELGESQTFPTRLKVVMLHNSSSKDVTFTAAHKPAVTLSGTTYDISPDDESTATMTVNGQDADKGDITVMVPAGGFTELNLAISAPSAAEDLSQFGGYLMLDSKEAGHLTIPYMGFKGDYQAIPVLTNAGYQGEELEFPLLAQNDKDGVNFGGSDKRTYTLSEVQPNVFDKVYVRAHFNHQARKANLDVLDASGAVVAELDRDEYVARNAKDNYTASGDDVWNTYVWDGTDTAGKNLLPNGDYSLRLRVLKPLGVESNPSDWEVWTSDVFTLNHK